MLRDFVESNRGEILERVRARVGARNAPVATEAELAQGLPVFLDQLCESLQRASSQDTMDHSGLHESASLHGQDLYRRGFSFGQVVHDYGDICQVITGLAVELNAPVEVDEFRTLNLCLDDAIAGAVEAYAERRDLVHSREGAERLGILAHEMRNLMNVVIVSFATIRKGTVSAQGSTGAMLERNLMGMNRLIDRSLADVRLDAGLQDLERVPVCEVIDEVEIGAALAAQARGIRLAVVNVDPSVVVEADRQVLAAALANLVQNAVKFTKANTEVRLTATSTATHVSIEVEDRCGGLPLGTPENLLRPFVQRAGNRSGLGLGLYICLKAMRSMGGELRIRDLPGQGCVFTIELPKQPPPPTSLHERKPAPKSVPAAWNAKLARSS